MTLSQTICDFVTLAIQAGGWMEMDRIYLQNRILGMIGEEAFESATVRPVEESAVVLMDQLVTQAKNQVIGEALAETEILEAQLMDFLTPPPSVVNAFFAQHYAKDPQEATDYFTICVSKMITSRLEPSRKILFSGNDRVWRIRDHDQSIQTRKDPKEIAAQRAAAAIDYPKCLLCLENEGYKGRLNYPARTNHRIIRMNLDGEAWGLQYSPYAYYNEHSIFCL